MKHGHKCRRHGQTAVKVQCVETGKVYDNMAAAARALSAELADQFGITGPDAERTFYDACYEGIRQTARGHCPTYKGYHWLKIYD